MGHVELDFASIPKLYGPGNFWHWHMLLRAYLESADLWRDDHPKEVSAAVSTSIFSRIYTNTLFLAPPSKVHTVGHGADGQDSTWLCRDDAQANL